LSSSAFFIAWFEVVASSATQNPRLSTAGDKLILQRELWKFGAPPQTPHSSSELEFVNRGRQTTRNQKHSNRSFAAVLRIAALAQAL
jgi:hypothetical protein